MLKKTREDIVKRSPILIEVPEHIYYVGQITIRYTNPNGEWCESTIYPNDYENVLTQALNDYKQSIIEIVDEQIKIWKSMDEDLPVPRLQDQIVEALNDIKEELGK